MRLMNNITGESQVLAEEILSKQQVLLIQLTLWNTDFPTLLYAATCEIPTPLYTSSLKKVPLSGGATPYRPL